MSSWLLQESFNTICATTILLVEECVNFLSSDPNEQSKLMQGILDLLLHVLTTPQSSVTHLRAVGGALQVLSQFGVAGFLEITGPNFQHWVRVILTLMNSLSLSVRSIAVDFIVSLLGSAFELEGNIDAISMIFASVLPEVVARQIALHSVSGNISSMEDVAISLWPIRRAIADLEDADPVDDDRVDPLLAPILSTFCRALQAVIDGVLVEMRLKGDRISVVGNEVTVDPSDTICFDADEESLFEAAIFFVPETAPLQRIRWLLTLKSLHESKGQWVEAAEALFLCAHTISDSIPHLKNVWRPSRFALWSDSRRSIWLQSVGEEMGHPDRGNPEVMEFADDFLEPSFLGTTWMSADDGKLQQPTVPAMCRLLTQIAKEAVSCYRREDGMDELAYNRMESLLKVLMTVAENHSSSKPGRANFRTMGAIARKRHVEEEAAVRNILASISGDMTSLAERLLSVVQSEPLTAEARQVPSNEAKKPSMYRPCFVVVRLHGKKPSRFEESTTLPTFLEWEKPCVCRVPVNIAKDSAKFGSKATEDSTCLRFAQVFLDALRTERGKDSVILRTEPQVTVKFDETATVLDVFPLDVAVADSGSGQSVFSSSLFFKHFFHRTESSLVENTVAHEFPCALSRQRSLLTTEILPPKLLPSDRKVS
jgi:hypothetical protein